MLARRPLSLALPLALLALRRLRQWEPSEKRRRTAPADVVLTPEAAREARANAKAEERDPRSKPQVVELEGAGAKPAGGRTRTTTRPAPARPSDAEVRAELSEARRELSSFKRHLASGLPAHGAEGRVLLRRHRGGARGRARAWSSA